MFYNTSLLSVGQGNKEIEYLIRSYASAFVLMYNKASPVFANNPNKVNLNKDSSFYDDFSTASRFQARVSPVSGAIGRANQLEL